MYIWIGDQATQEEAIHAEQMGRSMFDVSKPMITRALSVVCSTGTLQPLSSLPSPMCSFKKDRSQRISSGWHLGGRRSMKQ